MRKKYIIQPECGQRGRSLWNNLVYGCNGLDKFDRYEILTDSCKIGSNCEFKHITGTKVIINKYNLVIIDAKTELCKRIVEKSLKEICLSKSCPLIDLPESQ